MSSSFNLGGYARPVTTTSAEAQAAFNRGLVWLYGYNHEAAVEAFEEAIGADPRCGAALWGLAYAIGPNYNRPWEFFDAEERKATLDRAHRAIVNARALKAGVAGRERPLEALAERFPRPGNRGLRPMERSFSDAMRKVYAAHPGDLDVVCIFAEALMNRTPWQLWDLQTGGPKEGASTLEAQAALERVFDELPGPGTTRGSYTCTST